jgi:mycothiol synthase
MEGTAMTTITNEPHVVPEAHTVPGLVLRRYQGNADHADMSRVVNERRRAAGMIPSSTPDDIANTYRNLLNCDPVHDIAIVELEDRVVGYARVFWELETHGGRAFYLVTNLAPETAGTRVARVVLAWQERRAGEVAARLARAGDEPVEVGFVVGDDRDAREALEDAGFRLARRHAEMRRPDLDDIPTVPLPEGLEIRPIDPADRAMHRRVYEADVEAFQDHWGATGPSEEGFREFVGAPSFDPRLWRVAFDGDRIAGQVLSFLDPPEEDGSRVGWTESISTGRDWRRRGVARALLADSLRAVRDAGATSAALGVDQQNANQALRLYESLGFRLTAEELEYRKRMTTRVAR